MALNSEPHENELSRAMASLTTEDIIQFELDEVVKFIMELSIRVQCLTMTRLKAQLLYHNFKRNNSDHNNKIVGAACLTLSIKHFNEDIENDAVIFAYYSMLGEPLTSVKDKKLAQMRKSLAVVEDIILRTFEFCLSRDKIALEYLLHFMNDLRPLLDSLKVWDYFAETAMRFVSDFYISPLCLEYQAEDIAVAIIYATLYFLGVDFNKHNVKPWLEALCSASEYKIFDIVEDLYKICNVGPVAERLKKQQTE